MQQTPIGRRNLAALAGAATLLAAAGARAQGTGAGAQDPIKIGILHSLSGTMAISETTLKDVMLMLIDAQNKKGGVLGHQLQAVVVDPASNWPLFAEKARQLITVDKVSAVFGCWTSVSRKSVLPVFEETGQHPVLPRPVRGRGEQQERVLHGCRAEPAGDPGRGLPDEREQDPALGAGRAPTTSIRARPTRSSRRT